MLLPLLVLNFLHTQVKLHSTFYKALGTHNSYFMTFKSKFTFYRLLSWYFGVTGLGLLDFPAII